MLWSGTTPSPSISSCKLLPIEEILPSGLFTRNLAFTQGFFSERRTSMVFPDISDKRGVSVSARVDVCKHGRIFLSLLNRSRHSPSCHKRLRIDGQFVALVVLRLRLRGSASRSSGWTKHKGTVVGVPHGRCTYLTMAVLLQ